MLYVVQHAEATSKDEDPERPLTERGAARTVDTATFLARAGLSANAVRHSGKLRAEQTAGILAGHLAPERDAAAMDGLAANDPPGPIAEAAAGWSGDTVLVSHLPFVAHLVALLVGADPAHPPVSFVPGTVVALEHEADAGWRITWMLRPDLLP